MANSNCLSQPCRRRPNPSPGESDSQQRQRSGFGNGLATAIASTVTAEAGAAVVAAAGAAIATAVQSLEMVLVSIVTAAFCAMALPHRIFARGIQGDALIRENISCERRAGTESRGAADLPKHAVICTAIDHVDNRVACGRERAPDLENEERIGVALGVESECSRQLSRRRK